MEETAKILNCSVGLIYKWVAAGKVPVVRLGDGRRKGIRVRVWWVEEYARTGVMPKYREAREVGRHRR